MVRHPSVIVHTFKLEYLWSQLANLDQILCVASLGWGKGYIRFWGRLDQNSGFHGNRNPIDYNGGKQCLHLFSVVFYLILFILADNEDMHKISDEFKFRPDRTTDYRVIRPWTFPLTLNGENGVSIFSQLLWIQTSSNLQEMRTVIKSWTGSNFGRIWPVILELPALQRWKKWCHQLFSVTFDWVFVKLAGNEDRHKSSNKFEFVSDRIIRFGVIYPWAPIFNPLGYIHVLNHKSWTKLYKIRLQRDFFETCNKWIKW